MLATLLSPEQPRKLHKIFSYQNTLPESCPSTILMLLANPISELAPSPFFLSFLPSGERKEKREKRVVFRRRGNILMGYQASSMAGIKLQKFPVFSCSSPFSSSRSNSISLRNANKASRVRIPSGSIQPPGFRSGDRKTCDLTENKAILTSGFARREPKNGATRIFCSAGRLEAGFMRSEALPERMKVVMLVAMVMCLCNADRVVMSVAIVPLAARYGWSSSFLGIVQSSFLWGYIFSSIVGGVLADRYGGKRVLAWGVMIWSVATMLTPWAADHSTAMLLVARALFGLAEGVALPSMNTMLSRWFPCDERATAVGISMAGFHLGNVISLLATPVIISRVGISGPFALFSILGFLWLSVWTTGITNNPRDNRLISKAELRLIEAGKNASFGNNTALPPIRRLFSKSPTWAIVFANVTNNWGYFVLLSWMPVYFKTVFDVNLKQAAWFSAIPWGMMAVSGYVAGSASDFLIKSGYSVTLVRKIMQSIGFIGPGLSLLCLNFARTPEIAALFMTVALSLSSFSQAGFLLNMQDIAPQYAGFLHGVANSIGSFAAIISTIGTGYFVQWLGSFQAFLTLTAGLYFITTIFWNLYATGERVF